MTFRNLLQEWYLKVPSPRVFSFVFATVYLTCVITGVFTLLYPQYTLLGVVGDVSSFVLGLLLIICGALAAYAGTKKAWKLERLSIYGIMVAITGYFGTIIHLTITTQWSLVTQLGITVLASLLFVTRLAMIWTYTYKPRG